MLKKIYCVDIEGDALLEDITKIYCTSYAELDYKMGISNSGTYTTTSSKTELFSNPDNILIMHNGIGYDGPAIEKVHDIKIKAEIIDTLFLSWYLYPQMARHGLDAWGEILGISKVEIGDWKNLSLEEYVHRCEVDVKIQVALWQQMWKHLMLLYGNEESCLHLIRHLNFKARCAALQNKCKWKLDKEKAEDAETMFSEKFEVAKLALEKNMPPVPIKTIKERPKKPFKSNGELSALGQRWVDNVTKYVDPEEYYHGNPVDYNGTITVITGYNEPNAGSSSQIKDWLDSMGWIPESFKYVRDKETNETRTIPQIKNQETGELCSSIERLIEQEPALEHLREMSIVKHRLGVVQGFLSNVDDKGYVYAAIQGLTNTLRFKHKICVNLPSVRKPYGELIRGLLTARNENMELCGSDMSSLEDRTKQHYMWNYDPDYVLEMQSESFDPHNIIAVTAGLMTKDEAEFYSWYKSNH